VFSGENVKIVLGWTSSHTLRPDECFQVVMHWTEQGNEVVEAPVCVQRSDWFVDSSLYGRADMETERLHYWSVRLARKETDAEGNETLVPFSPSSEEWSFYWK
jgi:hypothetical protein